jgi:hypothetical protein
MIEYLITYFEAWRPRCNRDVFKENLVCYIMGVVTAAAALWRW